MAKLKVSNKNKKTLADKVVSWPLFLIVLVFGVTVVTYRSLQQKHEKESFKYTEQSINEALSRMKAKLNDPLEEERLNYCYFASRKSGNEPIYCVIKAGFNYKSTTLAGAKKLGLEIEKSLISSDEFHSFIIIEEITREDSWIKNMNFKLTRDAEFNCGLKISYDAFVSNTKYHKTGESKSDSVGVTIDCLRETSKAVFQVMY